MRAEQIIARAMVEMAEEELKVGSIADISKKIQSYKKQGETVSGITLQRTPLGFHSREVAEFIGRLVTVGMVTQASPVVIITQEGIEWLKKIE